MESSSVQVTVAHSRKKLIYFCIAIILLMTITTTGILLYDKIHEQSLTSTEGSRSGGQTSLTSYGTKISDTTGTTTTGLTTPSTLSGYHVASISSETTKLTSVEQTTAKSSNIPTPLSSDVTFSTSIQTYPILSTLDTTTKAMPTCQPNISNTATTAGYPTDCSGFNIKVGLNAIHAIYPFGSPNKSVLVNCVSTDGIWTVIQRRFDGSVDFYRNWTDYKEGFGDASGEYWLGNDAIHQLTSRSNYRLKVVLKDWDNATTYAIYDTFRISDECDNYTLTVGGYHGDAGDSLSGHDGNMFSTQDRDNDVSDHYFCAQNNMGPGGIIDVSHQI